jgi:hypothetical protein
MMLYNHTYLRAIYPKSLRMNDILKSSLWNVTRESRNMFVKWSCHCFEWFFSIAELIEAISASVRCFRYTTLYPMFSFMQFQDILFKTLIEQNYYV